MVDKKIRDIPQIREAVEQARYISRFEDALPYLKPFLSLLGADVDRIESKFEETDIDKLEQKAEELGTIPDKFNDVFAERGWIIHADMDLEIAKKAVEKAEFESIEAGEEVLISHYDSETIRFNLKRMGAVEAFQPRMTLAYKALDDFEEGRYHACVPVVLALMDGLVQEVYVEAHGYGRNWSTKEAQLEAWDSLAGHSKGLNQLQELHLESRFQTVTDEIDVPYRNGIIHGMDLGYHNEQVAVKTWAALFALREWALKAEQGELEASDEPKPTLWESIQDLAETKQRVDEMEQNLDEWEPRDVVISEDIPPEGSPEDYPEGSPERALVNFLTYWQEDNYGYMAKSLIRPKSGETEDPGEIHREFEDWDLESFRLVDVEDVGAARTDITLDIELDMFGREVEGETCVTLIRLDGVGDSAIRGVEDGIWTITNRVVLKTPE